MNIQSPIAGQATTAGASSLTDTNQSWQTDIWSGYVLYIMAGRGSGQSASIISNDSSTLTIQGKWVTEPDHSSFYEIRLPKANASHINLFRISAMSVTAGDGYPYSYDGTEPIMPFDGTLEIDVYSSVSQDISTIMGNGSGSAKGVFAYLASGAYAHFELELAADDPINLYFSSSGTVALSLGAKQ